MADKDNADRPRGILGKKDRAYLRGELEYESRQGKWERETAIYERVTNALVDFHFLLEHMPREMRKGIFDPEGWDHGKPTPRSSVRDVIAFLFLGLTTSSEDFEQRDGKYRTPEFERELEQGLARGYDEHKLTIVEMDLDIEAVEHGSLGRWLERGENPPWATLRRLEEQGRIDNDALLEFVIEQFEESSPLDDVDLEEYETG